VGRRQWPRPAVAARWAAAVVVTCAVVAGAAALTGTPAGAAAAPVQVITVRAATASATTAVLEAWQRTAAGSYQRVHGPVTAHIGAQGIGPASERTSRTPAGQFTLTEAFGIAGNPSTALPYRKVDGYDWWVSDVGSRLYNTHQRCAPGHCPFNERVSERLAAAGPVYAHAVVIDYNRRPVVAGAGSAFFLHVTNGRPTAGCVAIPRANLVWLLRWLKPANHPIISMGVGSLAYAPLQGRIRLSRPVF
jgi:L,D-peptidoglycan transpeptidase YkuD (ErfK/YbiS/YcfS/YnhG family)